MNAVDHRTGESWCARLFVRRATDHARETDVLKRLAEYCSNEEIAADLVLSPEHGQDAYAVTVPEIIGYPAGGCRPPGSPAGTLLAGARDDQASAAALSWSNSLWLIVPSVE